MSATDALADQLEGLKLEQKRLWLVIPEPEQKTIAEYMDVQSLCRTDNVMTGRAERRAWQKALKNLKSVALNNRVPRGPGLPPSQLDSG